MLDVHDEGDGILDHMVDFQRMLLDYQAALLTVRTKLDILNLEMTQEKMGRSPIESIRSRLKQPISIMQKLRRRGLEPTLTNARLLTDIAGLRVICSFMEDVYQVRESLLRQDDLTLLQEKDYIQHPKENGYRSLHLIVSAKVWFSNQLLELPVEVQIRTLAMDLWASNEHKLAYKQDQEDPDLREAMKKLADSIARVDDAMQEIKDRLASGEEYL